MMRAPNRNPDGFHIVLVASSLGSNSLGRVHCLWLLGRSLGWVVDIVSESREPIWGPVAGSEFASSCRSLDAEEIETGSWAGGAHLVIACKVLPNSLGLADVVRRSATPVMVDVDDPDIENLLFGHGSLRTAARFALKPRRTWSHLKLRRLARSLPTIVSNPALQRLYGGVVIPHARVDYGPGRDHTSGAPVVAFVGTARQHKGIDDLREAVERLRSHGYRLLVTDDAPANAQPWESWIGETTLEEGMNVVASADIVALPSWSTVMSRKQLPAKLMDAMLAGRAIAVSELAPMLWAADGCAGTFAPGDVDGLVRCLSTMADPKRREALGAAARQRALQSFTVEACQGDFAAVCKSVIAGSARGSKTSRTRTDAS